MGSKVKARHLDEPDFRPRESIRMVSPEQRRLYQNATQGGRALSFGTPIERTTSESAFKRRTHLYTARCRRPLDPAHHIQHRPRAVATGAPTTEG
jgi:hypothetical protein